MKYLCKKINSNLNTLNKAVSNMLADGTLIFKWLADTDGYAKLFIYINGTLVAKIKQGTGM